MIKLLLPVCLFCLTACSTTNITSSFAPLASEAQMTTVYVYRPLTMPNSVYTPELLANHEYKLSIKNGQIYPLRLLPGETTFELAASNNYSTKTRLKLNLIASESYYIRIDTSLNISNATTYEPYQRMFALISVDEKSAISQIEQCCLAKSDQAEKSDTATKPALIHQEGFSVDKTQNPFSH